MALLLTERRTPEGLLVAVCDDDCVGNTYEDGDVSLTVTESFYAGEDAVKADVEAVVEALGRATTANIVGENAVAAAVNAGLVEEANVLDLDGTRHAQLLRL
jgi:hypothetical protein